MRKFPLLILVCLIGSTIAFAQKKSNGGRRLDWGLRTGLNLSTLHIKGSEDQGWRSGFVFGPSFRIRASENFSVQPELLYSSMGARDKEGTDATRLNYFTIPVLAKYKFAKQWAAVAGPEFDFLIQAKQVVNGHASKLTGVYEDNNVDLSGGIEFWPVPDFSIGARYIHGLSDINATAGNAIRNQGVQLSVLVKL